MEFDRLSYSIIGAALRVHSKLGPGLFESVYEVVIADELIREGIYVQRQIQVPIIYDDKLFQKGYRADLIVERSIVVEIKSVKAIAPVHLMQLLTYLRLANYRLGLLLNFDVAHLRDGIKRIVNNFEPPSRPFR